MDRFLDAVMQRVSAHVSSLAQPRLATISAFDPNQHAARVLIQPDGVQTGWLPLGAVAVGAGTGIVAPPAIGDQVLVVPQEGDSEHWHIVSRLFSQVAMPPVSPATGKPVQSGEVGIFASNGTYLHIVGDTIYGAAATLKFSGNLEVDGSISATKDSSFAAALSVTGDISSKANVSDAHGSLDRLRGNYDQHTHPQPGTSAPVPLDNE